MKKILLSAVGAAAAITAPSAASAAEPTTCTTYTTSIITGWSSCVGFYNGNVFNQADAALQQAAVTQLGGSFNGDFGSLLGFGSLSNGSNGARTINLGQTVYGPTIVGLHFGNIGGPEGNVSAFYKFDFGSQGTSSISLVQSMGLSNLWVYQSTAAVPEPGTWALLILGFAMVGGALRAARKQRPALNYV